MRHSSSLAGFGLFLAGAAAGILAFPQRRGLPAPGAWRPDTVTVEDFAGAAACADCHQVQYAAWQRSTHATAGGAPRAVDVIPRFDGTPIRFRDATVIPDIAPDGTYRFTVHRENRPPDVFPVDGVIGGGHLVGGGTQGFVTDFPDGTKRFLPFDFSRADSTWFCNTSHLTGWWTPAGTAPQLRPDTGWVPITPAMPITDCGDWPPVRVLGTTGDLANCQQCHGSQIDLRFDPAARRYETRLADLAIDCESCHGPAARHTELARAGRLDEEQMGVPSLSTANPDQSLGVCFRCHAVKRMLAPGYLPGADFDEHYSLRAPVLSDQPFLPDGRVRTFAYQQNHLSSACYLSGSMTCTDCHAPHGQEYRDVFGRTLDGRFDDRQCTGCHASKAADVPSHTHHPAASAGSRCVACHMPYLQQPSVGRQIPYARSDHTIAIPRPAFDAAVGLEGACRSCHADRSSDNLQETVDAWYGSMKPHRGAVTALMAQDARRIIDAIRMEAANPSGASGERPDLLARVRLLDRLVEALSPDLPDGDPQLVAALQRLGREGDLDVRAAALSALHLSWGEQPEVRGFLSETLERAGPADRALRLRWAWFLRGYAHRYREDGRVDRAVTVYRKALEVLPNHPDALADLAATHLMRDDFLEAEHTYRRALAVDSLQPEVLVNLGVVLERLERPDEAITAYETAARIDPWETLAQANLGNVAFSRGEYDVAIGRYQRAVMADRTLVDTQLLLAQSFILIARLDSALAHALTALEFDPDNRTAARMVTDLRRQLREN